MSPFVVIAILRPKPDKADALREILVSLIEPTLAEPGCIRYEMNEAFDEPRWIFTEQWASKAEWDAHMATPHLEKLKAALEIMADHFELFTGAIVES